MSFDSISLLTAPNGGWEGCRVWRIDLDAFTLNEAAIASLAPFETERAARLRRPRDVRRYLAAHCGLRHVLGPLVGCAPSAVQLRVDALSKPHLAHRGAPHFNLSHSGDTAVVAVCLHAAVGVDVEVQTDLNDVQALARHQLSACEWQAFQTLPAPQRSAAFLSAWTRKEAALKAIGCGLQIGTSSVDVGLGPHASTWLPPPDLSGQPVRVLPSLFVDGLHVALALHGDAAMAEAA